MIFIYNFNRTFR